MPGVDERNNSSNPIPEGWVMHLPPDEEGRPTGHITHADYEEALRDPEVIARLERVKQLRKNLGQRSRLGAHLLEQ